MSEWRECRIKDIALNMADAPFGSNLKTEDYTQDGAVVLQGKNIQGRKCIWSNVRFVSTEKYLTLSKHYAKLGCLVFPKVGTIGKVGILTPFDERTEYLLSTNTMMLEINPEIALQDFIYYFFSSTEISNHIKAISSNSVQPVFNFTSLRNYIVNLPPLPEQKAIAYVLSSLDDKIDLLHRQNKTLEAMAETLFRQWFVEEAQDDWEKGKIENLFTLQRGFDLPSQNRIDGPYAIYAASGYSGGHVEYKVKGPGVTTGRSGLLGKVFFVHEDFWPLNTSLYIKEFKLGTPLFSYFFLRTLDLDAYNAGSAVPTLNRNHVHEESILIPPAELIKQFEQIAYPLFLKIKQNELGIQTIETLRDTLLPKLMSGEVRVAV